MTIFTAPKRTKTNVFMENQKKKKSFYTKLHNKYRLVIMNNDTLEEKLNFQLSRFNVFLFAGTISIFLIVGTIYLIAFTPLREYIPGYADFNTRKVLRELSLRADSLERDLRQKDLFILNIRNIVEGKDLLEEIPDTTSDPEAFDIQRLPRSREDSILRAEIEAATMMENNYLVQNELLTTIPVDHFVFFPPLTGMISSHFNPHKGHFGVDVVAEYDALIKSVMGGTVILAAWTAETGYTIGIQHPNNIISIYKHNNKLLKEQGSIVKAGDAIAIIGDTGRYSTGTHLHFELWFNGTPVNPIEFIAFN